MAWCIGNIIWTIVDSENTTLEKWNFEFEVICLPVSLVDGVDDEHDGAGGAEKEGDDGNDPDVAVRAVKGQVEDDKGNATVLKNGFRRISWQQQNCLFYLFGA